MSIPALVSGSGFTNGPNTGGDIAPSGGGSTGDLMVAFACSTGDGSDTFPITINNDDFDSWTLAVSGGGPYTWGGLWYAYYESNIDHEDNASPNFVDASASTMGAGIATFSGAATSSPLDQVGYSLGDPVTANGVDSAVDDLVVAVVLWNGANSYPDVGFQIYGSDGNGYSTNWIAFNQGIDAEYTPFWVFANNAEGPSTLGTYPNSATATIDEFENAPVELIASFLAAS